MNAGSRPCHHAEGHVTAGMSAENCTIALEYIEMLDAAKRDRNQQKRMEKAMSSMGAASPPPPASWW